MNDVTKKSNGAVTVAKSLDAWGPTPVLEQEDIKVPQILTVQGTSKLFNGKNLGKLVNSITGEVLGGMGEVVDVVPLKSVATWQVFDMTGSEPKFVRSEPVTHENTKAAWNFEEDGKQMRRDRNLMFYVLLARDLAEGNGMPYVASFKRTSIDAGKKLNTLMYVSNRAAGLPPAGTVVGLDTDKVEKYAVTKLEPVRPATDDELGKALVWFKSVSKGEVEVHEEAPDEIKMTPVDEIDNFQV